MREQRSHIGEIGGGQTNEDALLEQLIENILGRQSKPCMCVANAASCGRC